MTTRAGFSRGGQNPPPRRLHAGTLGLALVAACGSPEPDESGSPEPNENGRRVVLGTGETAFQPIDTGDSIELIAGIQGGFHVPVSFQAYGYEDDRLTLEASGLVDAPGWPQAAPLRAAVRVRPAVDGEGVSAWGFNGFPLVVDNARCAHGLSIELTIAVSEEGGGRATDARRARLFLDEGRRSDDCGP